jgi:hypothetical protein
MGICAGLITSVKWTLHLRERFYFNHNFVVESYKKQKAVWPILPAQYTGRNPSSYLNVTNVAMKDHSQLKT